MLPRDARCSRRKFLASAAAFSVAAPAVSASTRSADTGAKLAVLASVYRPLSYAYHLIGRFLHGYPREADVPAARVHSLWVEQAPENDLSRSLARQFGFQRTRTVREALITDGKLAVDGVVIAAEHGNYPRNEYGQVLYPRFELFSQVVEAFRETGRAVPVFVGKHLSHDPAKVRRMLGWSRELGFALLAGSSLPFAEKRPALELPTGAAVREGMVVAYGPTEVYGSDALDGLMALMANSSGIAAVQCLTGGEVWRAEESGLWSTKLLDAALKHSETANLGDPRQNCGTIALPGLPALPAIAFLLEFADGARGSVLLLNGHVQDFTAAIQIEGKPLPVGCRFHLPAAPGARHFDCQAEAIERMIATGSEPYPAERGLEIATSLAKLMESHTRRGERIELS